ncbi:MAG TPA: di-heme oxidoredictase family protein [Candidatus Kapabacteria bacterium]
MIIRLLVTCSLLIGATTFVSCDKLLPPTPADNETLDGMVEGLTASQRAMHIRGDEGFSQVFTPQTGLGPYFVATSCADCHAGDGKGHPFTSLVRFGQSDISGNSFLDKGGPQLQNRAIPGFIKEEIPHGASSSVFLPPAVSGFGFIEAVSDEDILAMSDPDDADGDGISGVPNWHSVPSFVTVRSTPVDGKFICRFGRKGSTYDLHQQTATAYNQDMGITSSFIINNPTNVLDALHPITSGGPEVSDEVINAVTFYLQTLKAPVQRNPVADIVKQGKSIFMTIGCEKCHKETLKTGDSPIAALSNQTFHPYTDLLLHDMGSALDDGYTEGSAKTYEWRTPALWGLGLSTSSQGGSYFLLHDGRARSIEEAILLHGGEAESSNTKFKASSDTDKNALIKFLESL